MSRRVADKEKQSVNDTTDTPRSGPAEPAPQPGSDVDVAQLAQKVYRLMRDELRLERARGAALPR